MKLKIVFLIEKSGLSDKLNGTPHVRFWNISFNVLAITLSNVLVLFCFQALNADVAAHEKPVKSVCENGEALIPVLQDDEQQAVREDLDSIKTRYQSVKSETSARQSSLVEALLLSQQFRDIHKEVITWLDRCEENFRKLDDGSVAELQQERIKVRMFKPCTL